MPSERSNSTITRLAEAYWEEWISSTGDDAEALQYYTLALVNEVLLAAQQENWERAEQYLVIYNYGISYCSEEPLLTAYEHGLMHLNLVLADSCYCIGLLDEALTTVGQVELALEEGDKRRARSRMTRRPNSEVRFTCLGLRAACMFEEAITAPQDLQQAQKLAKSFWSVATKVETYFDSHPHDSEDQKSVVMRSLALWELEICKLCMACATGLAARATGKFNQRHGPHLITGPGADTELDSLAEASAWHWDFEVAKQLVARPGDPERLAFCARNRLASARLTFGARPLPMLEKLWSRQMELHRISAAALSAS